MKPGIQKHLFLEEAKKQVAIYIEKLKQTASIETFFWQNKLASLIHKNYAVDPHH